MRFAVMTESKPKRSRVSLLFARLLFFVVRGFDICGPRKDTVSAIPLCSRRWFQRVSGDSQIFLISDMTREKDFVDVAEFYYQLLKSIR